MADMDFSGLNSLVGEAQGKLRDITQELQQKQKALALADEKLKKQQKELTALQSKVTEQEKVIAEKDKTIVGLNARLKELQLKRSNWSTQKEAVNNAIEALNVAQRKLLSDDPKSPPFTDTQKESSDPKVEIIRREFIEKYTPSSSAVEGTETTQALLNRLFLHKYTTDTLMDALHFIENRYAAVYWGKRID